jgi:hypothetical protein
MTAAAPALTLSFVLLLQDASHADVQAAMPSIAAACEEQLNGPFSDFYGGKYSVRAGTSATDRRPGEIAVNLQNAIPEAPTAMGFHQVTNGVPDVEIGLNTVTGLTSGPEALSVVVSHEILETSLDPGANRWADRGDGTMCALEACDRVEQTTYAATNGVAVSNFLLPAAFLPGAVGPYDFLNRTTSANQILGGGYDIECTTPSDEHDVSAARAALGVANPPGPARRFVGEPLEGGQLARKSSPYSRTSRRGIRL